MKVIFEPLFGTVPPDTPDLEAGGVIRRRFEEKAGATVWPRSGLIRWADGSLEMETIWRIKKHLEQCGDYQSKWSWFPRRRRGRFFNLSLFWWPNYYHWICDVLPRLQDALPLLTPETQIILPPGLGAWQRRALNWLGIPSAQCVQYADKRPWKVDHLLYVSPVVMSANHEPKSFAWMRDRILQNCLGRHAEKKARRLYVTRRRALRRKVVNEEELQPVLEKFDFETVECESLEFEEQVRLFSQASVVAGPHGAGLTNICWSKPGTRFFEIFEPGSVRICFWSLARTVGLEYACGVGEQAPNSRDEPNISVDVRKFEAALEKVCRP